MTNSKHDIIAEFTKKITIINLGLKQYLQLKLRQQGIDLTFEMLQVMACLWNKNGINQQEIANVTIKDKASMTYLIDNLVKRKLVYRQEDASDRRNKLIFLTAEGRSLKERVQPLVDEMYDAAGVGVQHQLLKNMLAEMDKISENLTKT